MEDSNDNDDAGGLVRSSTISDFRRLPGKGQSEDPREKFNDLLKAYNQFKKTTENLSLEKTDQKLKEIDNDINEHYCLVKSLSLHDIRTQGFGEQAKEETQPLNVVDSSAVEGSHSGMKKKTLYVLAGGGCVVVIAMLLAVIILLIVLVAKL